MINKSYRFIRQKHHEELGILVLNFLSIGRHILKEVAFTPVIKNGKKYFNWGFGDVIRDEISGQFRVVDKIVSNNGDTQAVINTVISTLVIFFKIHPTALVRLEAVDAKRSRVYNKLIRRHLREIERLYNIEIQSDASVLISKK